MDYNISLLHGDNEFILKMLTRNNNVPITYCKLIYLESYQYLGEQGKLVVK